MQVEAPDEAGAVSILKTLRPRYEAHHHVMISDEALEEAVRLSIRYLPDRFLPDKAIDLMDEAAARVRIRAAGSLRAAAAGGAPPAGGAGAAAGGGAAEL